MKIIGGQALLSLVDEIREVVQRLPSQTELPDRTGVHSSAFGLAFALDYEEAVGDRDFELLRS